LLTEQFENETLPKEMWTHEAHLCVGLYYVLKFGKKAALDKIRINIKKYNVATGGANTDTSGYHETITFFWLWSIDKFLQTQDTTQNAEELFQQLLSSPHSKKDFPFEYYKREHLLSTSSRLQYNSPDIKKME
jgi:hypothetical protein